MEVNKKKRKRKQIGRVPGQEVDQRKLGHRLWKKLSGT